MGRRPNGSPPQLRRHRAKNLAYVYVDGRQQYLGTWNTPAARRAYADFVRTWEAAHAIGGVELATPGAPTVADLAAAYLVHAKGYYRRPDGATTSEIKLIECALAPLTGKYTDRLASDIRGRDLRTLQDAWVAAGLARKTVNKWVSRVKRFYKWALSRELVTLEAYASVASVEMLAEGRTAAPDYGPVASAPIRSIAAVLRELRETGPMYATILLVQYYSGARPSEACEMRLDELHRGGTVTIDRRSHRIESGAWVFMPGQHKNRHRGKLAAYGIGPRLQAILAPFIVAAEATPREDKRIFPGATYTAYAKRLGRCFERLPAVEPFAANQLRHAFVTRVERQHGFADASKAVGHSDLATTQIYVDRTITVAARIAAENG